MANQVLSSVENNFTKGLVTEFTGLNFPENAATDTDNCIYTLVGDVTRRMGFDYEANHSSNTVDRTSKAINSYKWNNAGGDGSTQIVVEQIGSTLFFYKSSVATVASPLSAQKLASSVDISSFVATGGSFDATIECQFTAGNGYLFVYHPSCDPFYCTFNAGTITGTAISIQIRDFTGVIDNLPTTTRPLTLSVDHSYNLQNQGWTSSNPWTASATYTGSSSTSVNSIIGSTTFTVAAGIAGTTIGQTVVMAATGVFAGAGVFLGTLTAYSGTTMTINITASINSGFSVGIYQPLTVTPVSTGYITTWHTALGNFPSNSDVWWYYKNSSGVFTPTLDVTIAQANAPQGHYILNAFRQLRSLVSGQAVTDVTTTARPSNGCWFQGRVWYTGVNAQQPATGDAAFTTWTENIYFSQIVTGTNSFGMCYQANDPTSETLFDLLPTDGGVITIQGSGPIYKLFPLMNAMLVFAANGVWYISGSAGIGFAANDYSIVKLSAVRSISGTSFVDVQGLPMFWNEEGIYSVEPAKQGQGLLNSPLHVNPLEVSPLTVGTIQDYYDAIPVQSKKFVRGVYDPINYIVQWVFKSTNETSVTDRYSFDSILNFNNHNKSFYPYSFDITTGSPPTINGIIYVSSPGGSTAPDSTIKYIVSKDTAVTFAEEKDSTCVDWRTAAVSNNYTSFFITGFKLHGQGQRRFQIPYLYMYSRTTGIVAYKIQTLWDYAVTGDTGRWSTAQLTNINNTQFAVTQRRHRLRGQGLVLQIKVTSVDGEPFDIIGWSAFETQNTGV